MLYVGWLDFGSVCYKIVIIGFVLYFVAHFFIIIVFLLDTVSCVAVFWSLLIVFVSVRYFY